MRIAQVAPLAERCRPRLYGGTERIASLIVEDEADAVNAVRPIVRARVRSVFEQRFTAGCMAADHVSVYRGLAGVCRDAAQRRRAGGDVDSRRP